jgi:exportin-1
MADKYLNEFKLLPDSWLYCDYILNKAQSNHSKVISLGILEDVIKTKWLLLQEDQRLGIRNFLVDILIKNVTDDTTFQNSGHYINKLNSVIVLVFQISNLYLFYFIDSKI